MTLDNLEIGAHSETHLLQLGASSFGSAQLVDATFFSNLHELERRYGY
ncbi:hypothetical protein SYN65AY6LI_09585 [Synechococcus sp. 65AY6Li]|nr:hypothetical protein SYN65AY6LI_09585 [Synechococcus sp. 65AY6Li]